MIRTAVGWLFGFAVTVGGGAAWAQSDAQADRVGASPDTRDVPAALAPWIPWILWDDADRSAPRTFHNADDAIATWPSRLTIDTTATGGQWDISVQVFSASWVVLPGDSDHWPIEVRVDAEPVVVLERQGSPAVHLLPGRYQLTGRWSWKQLPQKLTIPRACGLLRLTRDGTEVPFPNWDATGSLWLNRSLAVETQQDLYSLQIHRVIEDGSPIWLRTQLEITVSGKSREEELGYVLPEGWILSAVSSPLPVAIDEAGKLKAQLRAGTWRVAIDAFRIQDLKVLQYAPGITPAVDSELVAVRSLPERRTVELQGGTAVDVQMTTFPEAWRTLSVFEWKPSSPLQWVEKSRDMGLRKADELNIRRTLWLDDDGRGLTYQDTIRGQPKQISRLDVADGQELGVIRIDGQRQLITENPATGAHGIELRSRNPNLEAIGRALSVGSLSATGWQTNADKLSLQLYLPPGYRVLALFGADRTFGDWLTTWTLLDLFLLLVFSLAVFRIWGVVPALVAFAALGLSYHEPGSPRLTWFFLLIPIAVLRLVSKAPQTQWLRAWRLLAIGVLLLNLLPFLANQLQNALYPQLEPVGVPYRERTMFQWLNATYNTSAELADVVFLEDASSVMPSSTSSNLDLKAGRGESASWQASQQQLANMMLDPSTNIQTGIAKPEWQGNSVSCVWDGPVDSQQRIYPILISCNMHRVLTGLRVALLVALLGILYRWPTRPTRLRSPPADPNLGPADPNLGPAVASIVAMVWLLCSPVAFAQAPDQDTMKLLRERLLKPSDAFPKAAELPQATLSIQQGTLTIEAEVHAAVDVAVPIPGKLPSWSPLQVQLDGDDALVCRRDDGYLWVWVPQGVHRLTVKGMLGDVTEWVWTFLLKPKSLQVDAPEWNVAGLNEEGKPEDQLFLVRKEKVQEGQASYDQKNFRSVVMVHRELEIGLVWKVHNTVTRVSALGKAISVQIPLLPNERVLSSNMNNNDGNVDVNLSPDAMSLTWESELPFQESLTLEAPPASQSVERWSLVSSPVWNVTHQGLAPIYETNREELIPVWYPWPGESVQLQFRRPVPVAGNLVTIRDVHETLTLGNRQRVSTLKCEVESSLGGDFSVTLPETANVTELKVNQRSVPVRRQAAVCLIPLQPGLQTIELSWTSEEAMRSIAAFPKVELPEVAANIRLQMTVPESRWILWAEGPTRGPAVRFWTILAIALTVAIVLGRLSDSPLRPFEWIVLSLGLTQVHAGAAMLVVLWLFAVQWRGRIAPQSVGSFAFLSIQFGLIALTLAAVGVLLVIVGAGLLGGPEMFLIGNGSYRGSLSWFEPSSDADLPRPWIVSISVWFYRFLMLLWALWLANALLRWLQWWWQSLTHGGFWWAPTLSKIPGDRSRPNPNPAEPPILTSQEPIE